MYTVPDLYTAYTYPGTLSVNFCHAKVLPETHGLMHVCTVLHRLTLLFHGQKKLNCRFVLPKFVSREFFLGLKNGKVLFLFLMKTKF